MLWIIHEQMKHFLSPYQGQMHRLTALLAARKSVYPKNVQMRSLIPKLSFVRLNLSFGDECRYTCIGRNNRELIPLCPLASLPDGTISLKNFPYKISALLRYN